MNNKKIIDEQKKFLENNISLLLEERKFREALPLYDELIVLDPRDSAAWINRGYAKDELGDVWGALDDANVAKYILSPWKYVAYYNSGFYHEKLKLDNLAVQDYTKAIEINPDNNVDALIRRGNIYLQKGHFEKAYNDYHRTIELKYPEQDPRKLITIIRHDCLDDGIIFTRLKLKEGHNCIYKGNINEKIIILVSSNERMVLDLNRIHIGHTIMRHLKQVGSRYKLRFDFAFDEIFNNCKNKYCKSEEDTSYWEIIRYYFSAMNKSTVSPRAIGVGLYLDERLVAGDIGFCIDKIYSSITGYHTAPNAGTSQLILLAQYLFENGYVLIDFGSSTVSYDPYKIALGAEKMDPMAYKLHLTAINSGTKNVSARKRYEASRKLLEKILNL